MPSRQLSTAVGTGGPTLEGVVELPDGPARASVLLLPGSGPQDRDQTVSGQATFRHLRRRLVAAGFAASSWDDRGVGASGGDYLAGDGAQVIADAQAALARLRSEIPDGPVFLLGHSQGALIATAVTASDSRVAGLVLVAGAARPGREVLLAQHRRIGRAEGWTEAEVEHTLAFKTRCLDVLSRYPDEAGSAEEAELREELDRVMTSWGVTGSVATGTVDDLVEWEWRFILRHDPGPNLRRVSCPCLVIAGDRDTQVDAALELERTRALLEGGACPEVETVLVRDANHLFQETTTGRLSSYAELGEPFGPRAAAPIVRWLSRQL